MTLWPRSLAARTAVLLLFGLAAVQIAGLVIHGLDRLDVQRMAQARDMTERVVGIYRAVALTHPDQREELLSDIRRPGLTAELSRGPPPYGNLPEMPPPLQRLFRVNAAVIPLGLQQARWRDMQLYGTPDFRRVLFAFRMPDGHWLHVAVTSEPARPWHAPYFLGAFILMTAVAVGLTLWTVRRLTAPVRTLAAAAEALGRDVNAPPLPEDGPAEVAKAAIAFNQMAARIRRFVADRTELLAAIGHDLRTPITRLKLRAEFMEDDEQRAKMLADLQELEAMVSATLAFGRDARSSEPVVPLDLAELLRTILDETTDAQPNLADRLTYEGPAHFTLRARALTLKRALTNLVTNAANYGGSAHIRLHEPSGGMVRIEIEDDGPGIPPGDLDRVFEPFHRGDQSRNRETGGVGLGLPIARNILRAHGGDVVLANRPSGGVRAAVTLPA
ncbi:MAG: ATP-binding protein [Acetobacteraceae bacterium]